MPEKKGNSYTKVASPPYFLGGPAPLKMALVTSSGVNSEITFRSSACCSRLVFVAALGHSTLLAFLLHVCSFNPMVEWSVCLNRRGQKRTIEIPIINRTGHKLSLVKLRCVSSESVQQFLLSESQDILSPGVIGIKDDDSKVPGTNPD